MQTTTPSKTLDGRNKSITTFVVHDAVAALDEMAEGEVLSILTDDFEPFRADIAAWCRATGQRLVTVESSADGLRFLVEKGPPKPVEAKMAMVISSAGLEELLSPLGFALGAALEGIEVHLYFQGPAVRVLTRGFRPKLQGWARPFSRFAAQSMAKSGHIAAQDKLRQLRDLGAKLYVCGGSIQHFKVDPADLAFEDVPLVEYLTFVAVMKDADISLYM